MEVAQATTIESLAERDHALIADKELFRMIVSPGTRCNPPLGSVPLTVLPVCCSAR